MLGDWHGGKRQMKREWKGGEMEGSLEGRLREGKKGKRQFWAGPERPSTYLHPATPPTHLHCTTKICQERQDKFSTSTPHRLPSLIYLHSLYLPVPTSTHLINLKILQDWRRRTWGAWHCRSTRGHMSDSCKHMRNPTKSGIKKE